MIKVAVVGVNNIGKLHCLYYKENQEVEFIAVCDLNKDLANTVANDYNVKAYTDISEMLQKEDIDVVSIATGGKENGSHHYEPAMIAIENGKDVLVEKPLSNNIEEAREMVAFARLKGVRLACNLNHRFVPTAYRAKEWIEKGELGTLLFLNMRLTIGNPNESSPWIHLRALHPHSIDVIRYFGGNIRRVQAFMTKAPGRTVWSTASINLEFESGAVGHLTGSYDMDNRHPIEYCEVAGTKGRFTIEDVYDKVTYYPHNNTELKVVRNSVLSGVNGFNETFKNRLDTFIDEVKNAAPPEQITGNGAEALCAQEVIEAAILSQKENGSVINVQSMAE
ncbi:Gfo/Idh/MocA family protein [Lederbergia lenta]|uniref:NADH-dependent dehydrogenase n=1 Tax=Lederbergia lenta TaxID=1467 RepID=A0A2X4VTF1_LEDLE|nr:Gfo/Idh/MocA family oxidoreductase [Lederbergia lenta]MCM3111232.1 Gfo/Idh/MocA family oxidoreductase [Lederbergia lenta]MEC2325380.1 Gfo/Idh/MocA family oxidoreductase [Lederbergia lenta]SQI55557.1 NADH-dependent dehydrogenase [Lederbergia lenta]